MRFIELWNKLKIKLFAPATVIYRNFNVFEKMFLYCAWLPACLVFRDEPIDKETGYYKTLYINDKRVKKWTIIPRHALIEVRNKPKEPISMIAGTALAASIATTLGVTTTFAAWIIVGVAALAVAAAAAITIGAVSKKGGGKTSKPTYSSNDAPSLTGAKNEMLENQVPILIGRTFQVFNYAQFCTPLVKSGYGGNRFRAYFIPSYNVVRYSDFKLGDVLINQYRTTAVPTPQQAHGISTFIGWDNAQTESFDNKELTFDETQAVFNSAIVYYNVSASGTSLTLNQTFYFNEVSYSNWTDKNLDVTLTFLSGDEQYELTNEVNIIKSDLVAVSGSTSHEYTATKSTTFSLTGYTLSEVVQTLTVAQEKTRGSKENNLLCYLQDETMTIGGVSETKEVNQSIDCFSGDRNEIIAQSPTETKYGDIHFSFPQGLYKMSTSTGKRQRTTIKAEVRVKRKELKPDGRLDWQDEWQDLDDADFIENIYVRSIDNVTTNERYNSKTKVYDIGVLQANGKYYDRVTRNGNEFTFKTPSDLNYADSNFYECVGFEFKYYGEYLFNIQPIVFKKDNYFIGSIHVGDVVWRMDTVEDGFEHMKVVDYSMLPHVSQIAATFNATTQLDGEIDALGAIGVAQIPTYGEITPDMTQEEREKEYRNPINIIRYLLTDVHSNPNPMSDSQIDHDSFRKAYQWCKDHDCLCDGIINEEIKYENVLSEIATNNQLYIIPNKWGKVVVRVDTDEDNRPIKKLFNADNSWDLTITRMRGKLNRTMAIRCSFIDEETWSENEITGYWYNNQCNWQPEEGKDDVYYQTEKKDLDYVRNVDNVKRRIAYELEMNNKKNVLAEFHIAREVLDLEVLDRVLVADYTRINDGVSGTIDDVIEDNNGNVIGVKTSQPFEVKEGMTITIRSISNDEDEANVLTYTLIPNELESSRIMFQNPIPSGQNIIRKSGFYNINGQEFYYSGDLYMAGTSEILSMVVKSIEEVNGDDFTSKVTCRLY